MSNYFPLANTNMWDWGTEKSKDIDSTGYVNE